MHHIHVELITHHSVTTGLTLLLAIPWCACGQVSCLTSLSILNIEHAAAAAKWLLSYPTLCDPIDSSPPGSAVPGILQARTLEWVAISFSSAGKWKVKVKSLSRVQLSSTPWIAAHQAPPFMGFSRQEYWSGLPWPSPILFLTNWLVRQFRDLLSVTKNDLDAWLISF